MQSAHPWELRIKIDREAFFCGYCFQQVGLALASAVLAAPRFLSALSNAELAVVSARSNSTSFPEVTEAKTITEKAMQEAEEGWARAMELIAQRGGLEVEKKVA